MQYILTKEEYDNLVPKEKYYAEMDKVEKLNIQVLELSEFVCIKEKPRLCAYCDSCPIVDTCTKSKEFSK